MQASDTGELHPDGSKPEEKLLHMDPRRPREGKQTVLWTLTITSGSRNMPIPAVMEPKLRTDLFCRGHMDQRTGKNRLHGPTGHQKQVFYTGNGTVQITVMSLRCPLRPERRPLSSWTKRRRKSGELTE